VKRKLSLGGTAIGMRLSSDSRFLWISTQSPHALVAVALDSFRVVARVKLPAAPDDFDLSARGQLAAACFARERSVALLDLEKDRVERQVEAGDDPRLVRFRLDGRQILVANRGERSLTILDVPSGRVMVRLPLPVEPAQFCFKPDGGQLFVTGKGMDAVVIVHPYETEVSETILAGGAPGAMAVSANPEYLFVANPDAGDVTILEVATRRVLAAVTVGQQPSFVTFTPDNQYALVVNHRSGDLAVIRMQSITQRRSRTAPLFTMIPVGSGPVSAAVIAV
jgi:YVTN family beta-propeller protein